MTGNYPDIFGVGIRKHGFGAVDGEGKENLRLLEEKKQAKMGAVAMEASAR